MAARMPIQISVKSGAQGILSCGFCIGSCAFSGSSVTVSPWDQCVSLSESERARERGSRLERNLVMLKLFPSVAEKYLLLFTVRNIRSVGFPQRCSQYVKKSPFLTSDRMNSVSKEFCYQPILAFFNSTLLGARTLLVYVFRFDLAIFYLGIIPPNHQYDLVEISMQWLFLASDRDFGARLTDEVSKMLNIFFA